MKVECEVEEIEQVNESGRTQASVKVTCSECGHCTTSFGTGEKSVRRCLVLLKEECPRGETNYYVTDDA